MPSKRSPKPAVESAAGKPAEQATAQRACEDLVRDGFAARSLLRQLGVWLEHVEPGQVVIKAPYSDRLTGQNGVFHNAIAGALGEAAGALAALSLMPADSEISTVEYKINFIAIPAGQELRASARILRQGHSLSVGQVDITVARDDTEETVALVQSSYLRTKRA